MVVVVVVDEEVIAWVGIDDHLHSGSRACFFLCSPVDSLAGG